MYNLMVYPYNQNDHYILKHRNLLNGYSLKSLVLLEGQDVSDLKNECLGTDIVVSNQFEEELKHCDAVLFLNYNYDKLIDCYQKKIKNAILSKKKILLSKKIYQDPICDLEQYDDVIILENLCDMNQYEGMHQDKLSKIDIPAITVFSLGEYSEKFEVQLMLKQTFESRGYHILQFGTKEYAALFGMQAIPSFLFSGEMSLVRKIDMLNYYLNKQLLHTDYDAVILGIPGGILPYDKTFHNYYGELSLVINHAVDVDINILCLYHNEELINENAMKIIEYCSARLGCATDYLYMANTQFRILDSGALEFMRLDEEYCKDTKPDLDEEKIHFCHHSDEETKDKFYDSIVTELENNLDIV